MRRELGEGTASPDILLVFGGTNDFWAGVPIGSEKYADWDKEDLKEFAPAFCYMMDYLKKWNPGTKIYNITNMEVTPQIREMISEACEYYEIENIVLEPLDLQNGHPTCKGMKQIKEQVAKYIKR